VDLFADRDLKRMAPCARCPADDYPDALPQLADAFRLGPVMYTGGLENRPDVVRELAARRPLWGNPPEVLELVRNPFWLATVPCDEGVVAPRTFPTTTLPPGRWLRKPMRSAGGHGIRFATPDDSPDPAFYLQECIDGTPMSAAFQSSTDEMRYSERARFLGVSEQLIGEPWLHARPFSYAGSIGPVDLPQPFKAVVWHTGVRLALASGLRGLWGLDFILKDDAVYPVEVNPRYTASVEVIEHGAGFQALMSHRDCFTGTYPPRDAPTPRRRGPLVGKAIYFAPHRIVFPASGPWDADLSGEFDPWRRPAFADIPEPGEVIEPGSPVLTFFADGSTPDECRARLQSTAAELDDLFRREAPTSAETSP
jgi:predicted ATP-grasp superfamily ATP-dependent carboligase